MPSAIALAFPLGIWLGVLAWRTGSIWPSIVCHAAINSGWNALQILAYDPTVSERSWEDLTARDWAITGAVGYGFVFWLFGFYVTPYLGGILPVFIIRALTIVVLGSIALLIRHPLTVPRKHDLGRVLLIGVCDTTAYIAILSGTALGAVSIVTVLSSLYTTVTVVLAAYLLHERLHKSQWLGVALIFTGIVLVSL